MLSFRPDKSVFWQRQLDTGDVMSIHAQEIRREKTGMHADIAFWLGKALLGSDDLNLKKNEERVRLSNSVFKSFGDLVKQAYPVEYLKHDLDIFCRELPGFWEESQYTLTQYEPGLPIPKIKYVMVPYVLEDAITILYGPQGTGKSYLAKLIGLSICGATNGFWKTPLGRPMLYINLERGRESMERRHRMMMDALKINDSHRLFYLTAQGSHLGSLVTKLKLWRIDNPSGGFILDSLSFTQLGPLNDDSTGAKAMGLMRDVGGFWLVIGHTPRADATHLIGTVLNDAGADIMIGLSGERRGSIKGLALEVTKANDIEIPPRAYLAFEFSTADEDGQNRLLSVRKAEAKDFPELMLNGKSASNIDKLLAYLTEASEASVGEAADKTGVPYTKVSEAFNHSGKFVFLYKRGKFKVYGRKTEEMPF